MCVELCNPEQDPRRKVCTNYNETFNSDCEVYQARCFCDSDDERCKGLDYQHVHIEYYGECKQMPVRIKKIYQFHYHVNKIENKKIQFNLGDVQVENYENWWKNEKKIYCILQEINLFFF